MQIRDWMTTEVVTATPDTSMLKVSKMMKEYNIRRVPVVDPSHRVIGIISDRDVKDPPRLPPWICTNCTICCPR